MLRKYQVLKLQYGTKKHVPVLMEKEKESNSNPRSATYCYVILGKLFNPLRLSILICKMEIGLLILLWCACEYIMGTQ